MSESKNYSVDDILEDIRRQKSAKADHAPHAASQSYASNVDSLVAEIMKEREHSEADRLQKDDAAKRPAADREIPAVSETESLQDQSVETVEKPREEAGSDPQNNEIRSFTMADFLKESAIEQFGVSEMPPEPPEEEPEPEEVPESDIGASEIPVDSKIDEAENEPLISDGSSDEANVADEANEANEETVLFEPPGTSGAQAAPQQTVAVPPSAGDDTEDVFEYRGEKDEPRVMTELVTIRRGIILRVVLLSVLCVASFMLAAGQEMFPQMTPSVLLKSSHPLLYLVIQFAILIFSLVICCSMVREGLSAAFRLRPDRDSMASIALIVSIVGTAACFFDQSSVTSASVHLYTPVVTGMLLFYNCAKLAGLSRMIVNFRAVSSPYRKYIAHIVENEDAAAELTRGAVQIAPVAAVHKNVDFVSDFIAYSTDEDITDDYAKFIVPAGVGFALLLSVVSGYMTKNVFTAFTTAVAVLCVFSPFAYLFAVQSPLSRAARKYSRYGSILLSAGECADYDEVNAAVVTAYELFPGDSVSLFGIKTFAGQRIDEALIDAASVINESGSVLTGVFEQITGGDLKLLRPVDTLVYEDGMGITAWVDNRRVLIGSRELMINHGISVPSRDYEERYLNDGNELVYLSTSGELTAVFLIRLFASPDVKASVQRLFENGIRLVVKSVDAVVTRKKLAELFGRDESAYKILPSRLHALYDAEASSAPKGQSSVLSNGMFSSFTGSLIAAKRVRLAVMLGAVIQFAAIGVGLALLLVMTLLSGMSAMKVTTLFFYEMLWLAATLLVPRLRTL